ncbi:MAG: DUF3426 domain-containing protein [Nitrosomonas sp.]|nr:DUF3426 domain-containing protein [Nitrosomonas sp.]MDP1951191.1 DUF3426 domain-containing protein [Nitrosomonas sp.]
MALVTLCPECRTSFRVTSIQLKAHDGDVRCGHCHQVFNSFASLIAMEASEISNASKGVDSERRRSSHEATSPVLPGWNQKEAQRPASEYYFEAKPQPKSNPLWIIANLVLLLVLTGQAVYFYRAEISVTSPGMRLFLERYCVMLHCTVPYPQDITQLSIESSDLRENPAHQPKITTMTAILRNHASFPLALPALKLSLTDNQDQLLASRIFTADDYFSGETNLIQAIAPNHEIEIRIDLERSELNATGYRLLLLYP